MPRSGPLTSQSIIRLGGSTGPLLRRNGNAVEVRLPADDNYTNFVASAIAGLSSVKSPNVSDSVQRQRVLNGPIDATTRQANALSNGGGLVVILTGTGTPLVLCFGLGYDSSGANNVVAYVNYNLSYTLSANGTFYLYLDRNASTAIVTAGFSTLQPTEGRFAPTSPSTDQHWFDVNENLMKRWDGAAWVTVQRIFVGQAVTGTATLTSVITYPYFQQGLLHQWHHLSRSYEQKIRSAGGTIRERRLLILDNWLIRLIIEAGLESKIRFLIPFASDTLTGANVTLIKNASDPEPTFVNISSSHFYSWGITGNGTSSHINTNHSLAGYTSGHFFFSVSDGRRTFKNGGNWANGVEQSSLGGNFKFSIGGSGGDPLDFAQWNHVLGDTSYTSVLNGTANTRIRNDEMTGEHIQTRIGNAINYFYNRRNYVSTTTGNPVSVPTIPPYILAANYNGSPGDYNFLVYRGVSFGEGLSDIEATNYQQIWANCRNLLA